MTTFLYNLVSNNLSKSFIENFLRENNYIKKIIVIRVNGIEINLPNEDIELIYLEYENMVEGSYENYKLSSSLDLIEANYKHLLLTLKMMDRLGNLENYSSSIERFNMLFNHYNFLSNIIEEHNIDIAIFQNLPHEIYDYVLFNLLKYKEKKTFYFLHNQYENYYEINQCIENAYPYLEYQINSYDINVEISPDVLKLFQNMRNEKYDPFYMSLEKEGLVKKIKTKLNYLKASKANISELIINKLLNVSKAKKVKSFINSVIVSPDIKKKYIFIPLHFQPEMTTSPRGGIFVFQELLIQMISNYLPTDWVIYVKEHPKQNLSFGRSLDFYKKINSVSNVFIVDDSVSSFQLMKSSKALAIVTGTLGFKALCNQIPVFVFGEVFYKYAPGVFAIKNEEDLENAFKNLNDFKNDKKLTLNYLEVMKSKFYKGYSDDYYQKIADIDFEININSLVENMTRKINFLQNEK